MWEDTTFIFTVGMIKFNEKMGVSPAMRMAMETGSMFGWDVPGTANLGFYTKAKTLVEENSKKKD